jgi:Bifunctional DNA primase/polymerase, N-terminal
MNSLGGTALAYAARGWQVLPVHTPIAEGCSCGQDCGASAGKHPRTLHGFKEASRHPDRIWHWWRRWPDANIGIRTGQESRLVVLDVDGRHRGEESLEILEATYDRLPPTLTAQSGSGGRHLYFQHPGQRITNSAQLAGFAGLDVRGDGGYIVAPPSLHRSGQRYAWVDATHPLAALPLWLRELFAPPEQPQRNVAPVKRLGPPGATEAYWLRRALERARPGTRNVTGFWLACHLRDEGVRVDAARAVLLRYAEQVIAGDHPYEVREALSSLRSAYQHARTESALIVQRELFPES